MLVVDDAKPESRTWEVSIQALGMTQYLNSSDSRALSFGSFLVLNETLSKFGW